MTEKLTYAKALEFAIANLDNEEIVEKLEALKVSLEKKQSRERKPTKTQVANESVKIAIVDFLKEDGEYHPAKEIGEALELSVPKVSALLKQLIEAGAVERTVEKGRALFKVAEI
jgi:DNA-binding transcriptional ArsR family regulator